MSNILVDKFLLNVSRTVKKIGKTLQIKILFYVSLCYGQDIKYIWISKVFFRMKQSKHLHNSVVK